jgi:hypothetical protein
MRPCGHSPTFFTKCAYDRDAWHDCLGYQNKQMSVFPKALHLPPPGRPRWVCPESARLDLLYLAWGHRQYGQNPIPVSRHTGWHYVLINWGKPTLILKNEQKTLKAGDFLVIDPDCASGWADEPDGVSELLVWIWRTGLVVRNAPRNREGIGNGRLASACGTRLNIFTGRVAWKWSDPTN